jgi:uncharacterized protein
LIEFNTVLFLLLVAIGAFIQTVSGFAMGLIIIAGATLLGLEEIAFSAAVISIVSLLNSAVALRTTHRRIDFHFLKWITITLVPGLFVGVLLLDYLTNTYYYALRLILAATIITAGIVLMARPSLYKEQSGRAETVLFGALGGIIGGLYSAGGTALAYHMYRQPIDVAVIRATLLSFLLVSTFIRTVLIAIAGQLSMDIIITSLISVPLVVVVTLLTGRFLHHIPDRVVRNLVFVLLTGLGVMLLF